VLYSGNISKASNLEVILHVASTINQPEIMFVVIGDGFGKSEIQRQAKNLCLNNCIFLPWQDTRMLPFSMASANIAVVTLPEKSGLFAIPSKVFNYMSVGVPILSISSNDSDLAKMVKEREIGANFMSNQPEKIIAFIRDLYENESRYKYFSKKSLAASLLFTRANANKFVM
jgi:hypothetical protein